MLTSQVAFAEASIYDRIAFAHCIVETGLPMCRPENKARKLAWEVRQGAFSSPVERNI